MNIIDIGENDIEPVSIKINEGNNSAPSVNFGDGIELLMNGSYTRLFKLVYKFRV